MRTRSGRDRSPPCPSAVSPCPSVLAMLTCAKLISAPALVRPGAARALRTSAALGDIDTGVYGGDRALGGDRGSGRGWGALGGQGLWRGQGSGGRTGTEVAVPRPRSRRNPSLKQQLFSYAILGFALSEAMGLFCLMVAFLILFAM
ncbi:ATP synthase F(0) complex subunit C2, mitochondrial [Onychostruthus taczanowskii]|uniref:ATP synthase F(0) complex subunit C2, mitochondrial n=1 Tax=Onychostruthus taczanowskii TaxID=356909 RepID=UPI001B804975|nr:ATP synthase F(0) complex subunit C2, mitochondrial [Onychostruthus taczanowskii]